MAYDLIAVHTIIRKDDLADAGDPPETIKPGSSFSVDDKKERDRLISIGSARTPTAAAKADEDEEEAEKRRLKEEKTAKAEEDKASKAANKSK